MKEISCMVKKLLKKQSAWLILLFALLINNNVYASNNCVEVPLVVEQFFDVAEGTEKEVDFIGEYVLKGLSENAILPESTSQDRFVFRLNGKKKDISIPLSYEHAGVYCYELEQTTKDKENYIFDRQTYKITVYVKNGETGKLRAQVIVENQEGRKSGKIEFCNRYLLKSTSSSQQNLAVKTGDEQKVYIWYLAASISVCIILAMIVMKRKREKFNQVEF